MKREGIDMKYFYEKYKEKALLAIVWSLPKSIVYWSAIRLGCNATQGKYSNESPTDLNFVDALKRW